jgi:hypothetical protein
MLIVLSLDCRIISQKPNAIPALLLRARRERLCGRAANKRDEFASFHRITSRHAGGSLNRRGRGRRLGPIG